MVKLPCDLGCCPFSGGDSDVVYTLFVVAPIGGGGSRLALVLWCGSWCRS